MPDSPSDPVPAHAARPDRDHRPVLRTLAVPRLLDRGLTPAQVAQVTGVPLPLVILIAEESRAPVSSRSHTGLRRRPRSPGLMPVRGSGSAVRARLLFLAAITAGCAGSILWHEPLLSIVLVLAGSLAGKHLRARLPVGRRHSL